MSVYSIENGILLLASVNAGTRFGVGNIASHITQIVKAKCVCVWDYMCLSFHPNPFSHMDNYHYYVIIFVIQLQQITWWEKSACIGLMVKGKKSSCCFTDDSQSSICSAHPGSSLPKSAVLQSSDRDVGVSSLNTVQRLWRDTTINHTIAHISCSLKKPSFKSVCLREIERL